MVSVGLPGCQCVAQNGAVPMGSALPQCPYACVRASRSASAPLGGIIFPLLGGYRLYLTLLNHGDGPVDALGRGREAVVGLSGVVEVIAGRPGFEVRLAGGGDTCVIPMQSNCALKLGVKVCKKPDARDAIFKWVAGESHIRWMELWA